MPGTIFLTNLRTPVTGTDVGGGKNAIDVNLAGGTVTVNESGLAAPGAATPASVKVVAGSDGTNTRTLHTDASGDLQIDVLTSALPTGASTEATLSALNGKVTAVNTGAVVVSSSSLPTGASTEATLSSLNGKVTAVNTGAVVVSSSALPSGAATSAKQDTGNTSLSSIDGKLGSLGQKTMAGSSPVVIASDQAAIPIGRLDIIDFLDTPVMDTSSVNITASSGSPVTVVATLAAAVKAIRIADTTGEFIGIYSGAAASEVLEAIIEPGMSDKLEVVIASGARVSLRNMANAAISTGKVALQFLG